MKFEFKLEENIFQLNRDLKEKRYKHGPYKGFYIRDPKVRHIHKATVRDRIVHHATFRILNPVFEPTFIPASFSCRIGKGNHKGVFELEKILGKVSKNYTGPCFVLKCDVKKFFNSIDHEILLDILGRKIDDIDIMWLLEEIIGSFSANPPQKQGLPIGNLTSQLFANLYMNEFDQFVKNDLKIKHYARYTDDFVIVSDDGVYLESLVSPIQDFLTHKLKLTLHPNKITVRKLRQGIDFLGYIILPRYKLLRIKARRRIFKKLNKRVEQYKLGIIKEDTLNSSLQSYLGVFSHANAHKFAEALKNQFWFNK